MKTMEFIFVSLLPNLDGKRVLDIGSRLGALLYGAYLFSTAKEIVGLEMNKDFCDMAEVSKVQSSKYRVGQNDPPGHSQQGSHYFHSWCPL